MHFTRRRILVLIGASSLFSLFAWWSGRQRAGPSTPISQEPSFRAWIDTLLPAEPDFPGGLALGVAERIAARMTREPDYAKLGQSALLWLDAEARSLAATGFAKLPEPMRDQVVAKAAASPANSPARTFFQASLDDALFHAYADPRAWRGLGYDGPPQPIGFPDQARAPGRG